MPPRYHAPPPTKFGPTAKSGVPSLQRALPRGIAQRAQAPGGGGGGPAPAPVYQDIFVRTGGFYWHPDPIATANAYRQAHPNPAGLVAGMTVLRGWHEGWEAWAGGNVYHFTATPDGGVTRHHYYVNGAGGLENVDLNGMPSGYQRFANGYWVRVPVPPPPQPAPVQQGQGGGAA